MGTESEKTPKWGRVNDTQVNEVITLTGRHRLHGDKSNWQGSNSDAEVKHNKNCFALTRRLFELLSVARTNTACFVSFRLAPDRPDKGPVCCLLSLFPLDPPVTTQVSPCLLPHWQAPRTCRRKRWRGPPGCSASTSSIPSSASGRELRSVTFTCGTPPSRSTR
ncbi:MAG: hypothetical protein KatS3mg130_1119 [Candidatus Sumerlaea sp.]|nr:MAG: hypothetical protein KatS3mg130_1119 [Candidatus Sumerlaea sp.]